MRWLLAILALAGLMLALAAPATAQTTRIYFHCDETRLTDWSGGREWVNADLVYHSRGRQAVYRDEGSRYCTGLNYATVSVNLDLVSGEGMVLASAHRVLADLDGRGGWDAKLVAHFTPGGPYIWEGTVVGNGWGELSGWQYRSIVVEPTHESAIEDGFVFLPGG